MNKDSNPLGKDHGSKILLIYLLFCLILLGFLSCTSASNGAINLGRPYVKVGYKLKGFHGKVHLYKENVADSLSAYSLSFYQFCLNHYVGENVNVRVRVINGDTAVQYIVTK